MSVAARRRALAAIIRSEPVSSQEEMSALLRSRGFEVTQATVSRDLEAIGAIRGKRDGRAAYLLADQLGADESPMADLDRILDEWRLSARAAGSLVVVRTRPGSAHVVAAAIDSSDLDGIAGTIAGDDTLFVALGSEAAAARLARRLAPE